MSESAGVPDDPRVLSGRLSPVARVVLFVDVLGVIATLAVVLMLRGEARTAPWWAPFALIALTVAGE
ncbi:MAG: hypothetical protein ABIM89_06205, partial [Mycobacteriales bacterium]